MNKLFVRLLVAFVAFSFSLVLINLIKKPLHRSNRPVTILVGDPFDNVTTENERQILAIYQEYGPAQTRHDRQFFERIETEDCTFTGDGKTLSREEAIKFMESQPTDFIYESRVDHLRVFDHLAVAHRHVEVRNGDGFVWQWESVDVWVKNDQTWQIQSTTSR